MSALAEGLATVEASLVQMSWPRATQVVRDTLSQRALVVLLTALDTAAVMSDLLPVVGAMTRDHQVVLASAADPEAEEIRRRRGTNEEVFDAAAAERAGLERAAAAARLRRRGVEVVEATPDGLPPALADTYLALKAAGRL